MEKEGEFNEYKDKTESLNFLIRDQITDGNRN